MIHAIFLSPERFRRGAAAAVLAPLLLALAAVGSANAAVEAAPTAEERAALERQLEEARGRLDDAARDVAELTGKLHGPAHEAEFGRFKHGAPLAPPRGAMLGINIGGEANQGRAKGVVVTSVSPSGPAEAAGLRKGDVLTAVDGQPLEQADGRSAGRRLVEHLRGVEPGQVVRLEYLRDGRKMTAAVTTVAAEPPVFRVMREHLPLLEGLDLTGDFGDLLGGPGRGFRSLELVPITPKLGQYFGADKGLLVVRAPAAPDMKLEEGDVILTIGGRTPESPRHAFRILGSYQPNEKVSLEVLRQRRRVTLDAQMPADARRAAPAPEPS